MDTFDYADTFVTTAPEDVRGDVERAARRFMASTPRIAHVLLIARDGVARLVNRQAERHAVRRSDEARPIVVGHRLSMFQVHRVADDEVVIGEDDRLMRYRILLRLEPVTGRFTCATVVTYGSGRLGRWYFVAGLPLHRWFVRSTMRRFARS